MTINASGLYSSTAFKGKVIGITAAAHGIGKATAELLGELGASLLITDINEKNLFDLEATLKSRGVDVLALRADAGVKEDLAAAVEALRKRWGVLYGWMNNAGINLGNFIDEQDEEEFVRTWQVNTLAAWRSLKLTSSLFEPTGGAIVNVSSILAARSRPMNMAYTSSKAGLEGLTRAMAVELAPRKIRVNCIIPGCIHVQTRTEELKKQEEPIMEHQRLTAKFFEMAGLISQPWRPARGPEDVANLAVFLLSNASPYVTGTSIIIDGALHAELKGGSEHTPEEFQNIVVPLTIMRAERERLRTLDPNTPEGKRALAKAKASQA